MYIAPGQELIDPRGQNLDANRKTLSFYPLAASLKEIFMKSDLVQLFFII